MFKREGGRYRRLLLRLTIVSALAVMAAAGVVAWRQGVYDGNIDRISDALPTRAPSPSTSTGSHDPSDPGKTWLLIGSDERGDTNAEKWSYGESHSDAIMLLHLPSGSSNAYIVSVPRDSWVDIPGYGERKVNAAFSYGGPRLLAETIESLGDLQIDHVAIIDFGGFKDMTDALGGVDIVLDQPIDDPTNEWSWPAGRNHLDGREALHFVRERKGLPSADVSRVKHQHLFLKAMADKAVDAGTLSNPVKLDAFLGAASRSLAIDDTADMGTLRGLAFRLADTGPDNVKFISLPIEQTAWIGEKNVALLDEDGTQGILDAVGDDRLGKYIKENGLESTVSS